MIEIYTDGLAEPTNPGIGTYGYVIYRDGKEFARGRGFAGEPVTNNFAEYAGLLMALKEVTTFSNEEITVRSDSKMLVNQMSGQWRFKQGGYVEKYLEAKELAKRFSSIKYEWIPREKNTEADELSRVAYWEHRRASR